MEDVFDRLRAVTMVGVGRKGWTVAREAFSGPRARVYVVAVFQDQLVGGAVEDLLTFMLILAFAVLYMAPSYMAFARGAKDRWLILVINVFLGSSLIGWGVALYMATRTPKKPKASVQGSA
ncbi:superinfection immunity protein [Streptomyces sp. PA03-6a]|nr:superinfection immunity protein [Streptomyces sp. PA03-6a]